MYEPTELSSETVCSTKELGLDGGGLEDAMTGGGEGGCSLHPTKSNKRELSRWRSASGGGRRAGREQESEVVPKWDGVSEPQSVGERSGRETNDRNYRAGELASRRGRTTGVWRVKAQRDARARQRCVLKQNWQNCWRVSPLSALQGILDQGSGV